MSKTSKAQWQASAPLPNHFTSLVKTRRYCWALSARSCSADDAKQYRLGAVLMNLHLPFLNTRPNPTPVSANTISAAPVTAAPESYPESYPS